MENELFRSIVVAITKMTESRSHSKLRFKILLFIAIGFPVLLYFSEPLVKSLKSAPQVESLGSFFSVSKLDFEQKQIGPPPSHNSQITNVQIVDLDGDGTNEILVCDALRSQVLSYRRTPDGKWEESILAENMISPAHATVVDLDRDGDREDFAKQNRCSMHRQLSSAMPSTCGAINICFASQSLRGDDRYFKGTPFFADDPFLIRRPADGRR